MTHPNDVWSSTSIGANGLNPWRHDRTTPAAMVREDAAIQRQILFWRIGAVVCLVGFNIAIGLILLELSPHVPRASEAPPVFSREWRHQISAAFDADTIFSALRPDRR